MTASCQMQDVEGTRAGFTPHRSPWPLLVCTAGLICPVGGPSGVRRMRCLESGGPGCVSVGVLDVLNRILAAVLTGWGDVSVELAPIQGLGLFPVLPGMQCPRTAGSFPNPCPPWRLRSCTALPLRLWPCQAACTLVADVVLLCFTPLGRAWESLQEEGGMGTLSLPGTVCSDPAPSSVSPWSLLLPSAPRSPG